MHDYQKRVVVEKQELGERIRRLQDFIESDKINELEAEERDRLTEQLGYMMKYSDVLDRRICGFLAA